MARRLPGIKGFDQERFLFAMHRQHPPITGLGQRLIDQLLFLFGTDRQGAAAAAGI